MIGLGKVGLPLNNGNFWYLCLGCDLCGGFNYFFIVTFAPRLFGDMIHCDYIITISYFSNGLVQKTHPTSSVFVWTKINTVRFPFLGQTSPQKHGNSGVLDSDALARLEVVGSISASELDFRNVTFGRC